MSVAEPAPPTDRAANGRALALLVFGAALIGTVPALVRFADCGPAAAGFWRFLLAVPLAAAWCLRGPEGLKPAGGYALLAGALFAGDLAFWHYGIALTSTSKATVLANLQPVVVTLAAWWVFRERPTRLFALGLLMAVGGAWTLALARGAGAQGPNPLLGDLLSACTALWYGGYFLAVRQARGAHSARRVMFWSTLTGAPLMLAAALALREPLLPGSAAGWLAVAGLAAVHVAGQGSIAAALGRLPAATASVVVLLQPLVATVLGVALFGEALGPWQAVGGVVALAGVVVAQAAGVRRRPAQLVPVAG